MVSQRRRQRANIEKTFFEKLMNIQYLNLPPYPNRWMVWLIQQGLAWRPCCVKTCCQEDANNQFSDKFNDGWKKIENGRFIVIFRILSQ